MTTEQPLIKLHTIEETDPEPSAVSDDELKQQTNSDE
jgi:hypothetical protein